MMLRNIDCITYEWYNWLGRIDIVSFLKISPEAVTTASALSACIPQWVSRCTLCAILKLRYADTPVWL